MPYLKWASDPRSMVPGGPWGYGMVKFKYGSTGRSTTVVYGPKIMMSARINSYGVF